MLWCSATPRWSPQNRPVVVTSKPASWTRGQDKIYYLNFWFFRPSFLNVHEISGSRNGGSGLHYGGPGRRVGPRRDATRAPTPGPDHAGDEQALVPGYVLVLKTPHGMAGSR